MLAPPSGRPGTDEKTLVAADSSGGVRSADRLHSDSPTSLGRGNLTLGANPTGTRFSASLLGCENLLPSPGVIGRPRSVLAMAKVVIQICQLDYAGHRSRSSARPDDAQNVELV